MQSVNIDMVSQTTALESKLRECFFALASAVKGHWYAALTFQRSEGYAMLNRNKGETAVHGPATGCCPKDVSVHMR